jgi:hypothetical protein
MPQEIIKAFVRLRVYTFSEGTEFNPVARTHETYNQFYCTRIIFGTLHIFSEQM